MDNYRPKLEQRTIRQLSRASFMILLALLQSSFAPGFFHSRVQLVLIAVIAWTLLRGLAAGTRWAIYGGVSLAIITPQPIGADLLALTLVAVLIAVATEDFPQDTLLLPTVSVTIGSLVYGVVQAIILRLTGHPLAWLQYALTIVLPQTFVNTVIAVPSFLALQLWDRYNRRIGWI
ncbi:MAG: hypothetical protein NVS4B8_09500 [Herpetosiphon sp.]